MKSYPSDPDSTQPPMLPAEACSIDQRLDRFESNMDKMHGSLTEIRVALVGSKLSGPGLIQEFASVKKTVEEHDRKIWLFSTMSGILGAGLATLAGWLKKG